jgi:hypothetical protein
MARILLRITDRSGREYVVAAMTGDVHPTDGLSQPCDLADLEGSKPITINGFTVVKED